MVLHLYDVLEYQLLPVVREVSLMVDCSMLSYMHVQDID